MKLHSIAGLACLAVAICSCSKSAPPAPSQVQTQPSVGLQDPSKATSEGERQRILDENTRKYNNWHLEPTKKIDY